MYFFLLSTKGEVLSVKFTITVSRQKRVIYTIYRKRLSLTELEMGLEILAFSVEPIPSRWPKPATPGTTLYIAG